SKAVEMFKATLETRSFLFEAYGRTAEDAHKALTKGLLVHTEQHHLREDWYEGYDTTVVPLALGNCYRDNQALPIEVEVAAPLPRYQVEFPRFGILDVQVPEGFCDTSWHNDVCPSFSKELPNGNFLRIFIEYPDPAARETPDAARFY